MVERVRTGIYGLDELLEGGFPQGRNILVSGACGTGKTTFGLQYLYRGAAEWDEPGVMVMLDERPEKVREDMLRYGWEFEKVETKGKLAIVDASAARIGMPSDEKYTMPQMGVDVDKLLVKIAQVVEQIGAKRVVIDSVPSLGLRMDGETEVRRALLKVNYMLSRLNVTALLISEVPEQPAGSGPVQFSKYGIEEYMADGVVVLHYLGMIAGPKRTIFIRKMRGTKHAEEIMPLEITQKGIVVHNLDEAYRRE
jgi:KaiC/GvpD/RAD55 family RecA-like ATPase